MSKIIGGTSSATDRFCQLRKVLSLSNQPPVVHTQMTIDALNFKSNKMSYLAADTISLNPEELCFPDFVKMIISESDRDL